MFNFPNEEYFCQVSCPKLGFFILPCQCGDKEGGQDIYNDGGDGKKDDNTDALDADKEVEVMESDKGKHQSDGVGMCTVS